MGQRLNGNSDVKNSIESRGDGARPGVNEVRALTGLAFDELRRFPGAIRDMHLGIAERVFRGVGPAALPVKIIHDAISSGAYGTVAAGISVVGKVADRVMESTGIGEGVLLSKTPRGNAGIAALNGLIGDRLRREGSSLHQPVSVREKGDPVGLDRDSLKRAFPNVTGRVAIFLHGLSQDEFCWTWGHNAVTNPNAGEAYGARLVTDLGYTPVYLRYNSGLHISENGRAVAELLEELVHGWPVGIEEIAFIGHSMGGLVARSAAHHADEDGQAWVGQVRHIVSLGSPHMGAPLEKGAHWAAIVLGKLPETRMISSCLKKRSAGIRDLRHGSLVDEDWRGQDPEVLRAAACREVPLLPHATHYFVSASVTRDPKHTLGRLLGDTLVLVPSAQGRSKTRRLSFDERHGYHVGGTHHLALLNHPVVYECLRDWLATVPREVVS